MTVFGDITSAADGDGATFWPSASPLSEPFTRGQRVRHRRGHGIFRGLDEMDPSGDTAWVQFTTGDAAGETHMVTTSLLAVAD